MDRDRHCCRLGRELLADLLRERPGDEVWRGGFDANLGEHHRARLLGCTFIFVDHRAGPRCLAGHIHVVRAILGACPKGKLAILCIGANGGDKNVSFLYDALEILVVEVADFNLW